MYMICLALDSDCRVSDRDTLPSLSRKRRTLSIPFAVRNLEIEIAILPRISYYVPENAVRARR